jgi:hypothetical protein
MHDETERVPTTSLRNHSQLEPPRDPMLMQLLERALKGDIPVYFAAIPLRLVRPFSTLYNPSQHPAGRQAIAEVQERWKRQEFTHMVVYQQDDKFVMSDDYITYYACLEGNPDYVPCWVLGNCTSPDACDVQGPIRREDLRRILLGTD